MYDTVAPHANRKNNKLDQKDELLMTLIILRWNVAMEELAYRFDTSISQVNAGRTRHVSGFVVGDRYHEIVRVFLK